MKGCGDKEEVIIVNNNFQKCCCEKAYLDQNLSWLGVSINGVNLWFFQDKKWWGVSFPGIADTYNDLAFGKYFGQDYFFVVGGYSLGNTFAIATVTPKLEVTDISTSLPNLYIPDGNGNCNLTSVAYDRSSNTWATVGQYPYLFHTRGCNWEYRFLQEYFKSLWTISSDGKNNWVIGGVPNNWGATVYYQLGGLNGLWSTTNVTDGVHYGGTASNGELFVAATNEGTIWVGTVPNLQEWKKVEIPLTDIYFTRVIWNGKLWIASWSTKNNKELGTLISTDAENWTVGIDKKEEHQPGLITLGTNTEEYIFDYVTPAGKSRLSFYQSTSSKDPITYIVDDLISAVASTTILPI